MSRAAEILEALLQELDDILICPEGKQEPHPLFDLVEAAREAHAAQWERAKMQGES